MARLLYLLDRALSKHAAAQVLFMLGKVSMSVFMHRSLVMFSSLLDHTSVGLSLDDNLHNPIFVKIYVEIHTETGTVSHYFTQPTVM